MTQRQSAIINFLREEALKWLVRTSILLTVGAVGWLLTPLGEKLAGVWNSPTRLSHIEAQIEALATAVARATGEDRVIRQPPGQSYVTEPVRVGEQVTLNLVVQRTTLGATCRLIGGQSLFTDASGVASAGSAVQPMRQIDTAQTRLRVILDPPARLIVGRIEVYLALEYDCGGRRVFDRTETVTYQLMEAGK